LAWALVILALGAVFSLALGAYGTHRFFREFSKEEPVTYDADLYRDIRRMASGYPIVKMAEFIAEYDALTAAYVVAIAKKESNWGKVSPSDADGRHCYNYWGFRLDEGDVTPSGYTCFASPEEAVDAVAGRIREMVHGEGRDDPGEMVVWKCGYDCAGHSEASVVKWARDVGYYVGKMLGREQKAESSK